MATKAKRISQDNKQEVAKIKKLLKEYPIIGVVDVSGLSSGQLQKLRKLLRNDVVLYLTKKRLIKFAIDGSEIAGLDKLKEQLKGIPILVFAKENPFRIARLFDKNKSNAPAKAGQIAPKDILIPAGPTPFVPGPIIGELGSIGLKTEVKDGKLLIRNDTIVAKKGEPIKQKVAEITARLGIEPMEVGLNLIAAFEKGVVYLKDVLTVDDKQVLNDLIKFAQESMNLSVYIGFITKDNIDLLLRKAALESKAIEPLVKLPEIKEETKMVEEKPVEIEQPKVEIPKAEPVKVEEKKIEQPKAEEPKIEEKKPEIKVKENIVEEVIEKVKKNVAEKPAEPLVNPTKEDMAKTEQFVKDLMDKKIKPGDTINTVIPEKPKEKLKKIKKDEQEKFKEEERIAQQILKKV